VVAGRGGRGIPADIEVPAYEPPTRYALFKVAAGPARPVGEYRFARSGNATEVTFKLRAELSGVKNVIMSGPVRDSMDGEMAALDTAKALIESASRAAGRSATREAQSRGKHVRHFAGAP
jgi:hypothetical protein